MNYHASYGQVLSCSYRNDANKGYTCGLTIQNPNGFNNFTEIGGTHLAGKTNEDVQYVLGVYGSNTTNIPSIICEKFQNATGIELRIIGIDNIDENSLKNCKQLTYLELYGNKISKIDEKSFIENLELQTLYLNGNQLTILPENVFANQHKLITLWLDINKITDLPENIFISLRNLDRLDLQNNQIKNLRTKWFENLENLNYLVLSNNQIEELPRNVFSSLKKLPIIFLHHNELKVIHSFGILPNLTEVLLYINQINALDEKFIDNIGVELLDVRLNLCANVNIFDNSTSKQSMRSKLQKCFDNYKVLYPGNFRKQYFFS